MKRGLPVRIRAARPSDAAAVAALLRPYARAGLVLPRPAGEIAAQAGSFLVAYRVRRRDSRGRGDGTPVGRAPVVGCVSVRDYGTGLVEVRSLAVAASGAGKGLGTRLVRRAVGLAHTFGARRVFALTLRPHLFERLGFRVVEKERFPEKVWADCRLCAKRERCDEIAVLLDLR